MFDYRRVQSAGTVSFNLERLIAEITLGAQIQTDSFALMLMGTQAKLYIIDATQIAVKATHLKFFCGVLGHRFFVLFEEKTAVLAPGSCLL